jgi:hypothetical protein
MASGEKVSSGEEKISLDIIGTEYYLAMCM